jgi:hypothetical protein
MVEGLPALLTVEEAAEHLRIGRTKAYAMAREWRNTGGRSGLPVVDLGNVLRVPLHALEQLIGVELSPRPAGQAVEQVQAAEVAGPDPAPPPHSPREAQTAGAPTTAFPSKRRRRPAMSGSSQLDLFRPEPT